MSGTAPLEPTVSVFPDRPSLMDAAARRVTAIAEAALARRGRFTWALAGGSTPRELYRRLAPPAAGPDWARVHFFWGDERCVAPEAQASNYRMARQAFLDALAPPADHVHRMAGEDEPAAAAAAYERGLRDFFGAGAPPVFDLVLLGMGPDGHTASLFPGTAALDERERWVVANRAPDGSLRLTLTFPVLNAAAQVLVLVAGREKAQRLRQAVQAGVADPPLPVQRLRPASGRLEYLADAEAAAALAPR